jgi:repressor LexA
MHSTPLTQRQQTVLQFIESYIHTQGVPPTRAEICAELGFRSPNAAEDHLRALAHKGAIQLIQGTSRGIRLHQTRTTATTRIEHTHHEWQLPVIGRVAAGTPIMAVEHIEKTITCHAGLFKAKPDFLLRVQGMSMRDAGIMDGDLIGVSKTPPIKNHQIIVARLEDEVTVKRFYKTAETIELRPENPDFNPIFVSPSQAPFLYIEGVVVGLIREQISL